jgi:EAL domain-containing protein (putative c-di-GMP-specific phosphodiesterase class I)
MSEAAQDPQSGWFLESAADGGELRRVPIGSLPFRIGRRRGLELVLTADSVSKTHAELYWCDSGLRLRDLGSRNGTFLNREPVTDAPLEEGDILHFAAFEFRLGRAIADPVAEAGRASDSTAPMRRPQLPHGFAEGTRELRELLRDRLVTAVYQPIVLLPQGTVAAYEALGRGRHPRLPESPAELLRIAETIGAEAELSRLFRSRAVELLQGRSGLPTIFLNTHPIELARPGLLESLEELRGAAPELPLALEIHESVLTRPAVIKELRAMLQEREIALAYDDFGAGQARLLELAEAPPHYLKFDRGFISGLDRAPLPKRRLLEALLGLARELKVATVAEGVETVLESQACAEIGFTHAQGFAIGRPRGVDQLG